MANKPGLAMEEKELSIANFKEELIQKRCLKLGPLRPCKHAATGGAFMANITSTAGERLVFTTPPFISYGVFKNDLADSSAASTSSYTPGQNTAERFGLTVSKALCGSWISEFLTTLNATVYAILVDEVRGYATTHSDKGVPQLLVDIAAGGVEAQASFMTQSTSKDDVWFARVMPDCLVVTKEVEAGVEVLVTETLQNMYRRGAHPRSGVYQMRIVPRFIFLGQHGAKRGVSIHYDVDQMLFQPGRLQQAPTHLVMDGASFFASSRNMELPDLDVMPTLPVAPTPAEPQQQPAAKRAKKTQHT